MSASLSAGWFRCGRVEHIKPDCPLMKKKRAYHATWSANDDEDEDQKEVSEIQLIAIVDTGEDQRDEAKEQKVEAELPKKINIQLIKQRYLLI